MSEEQNKGAYLEYEYGVNEKVEINLRVFAQVLKELTLERKGINQVKYIKTKIDEKHEIVNVVAGVDFSTNQFSNEITYLINEYKNRINRLLDNVATTLQIVVENNENFLL